MSVTERVQHNLESAAANAKLRVTSMSSWALPKQSSSLAPDHVWTNSDQDPVPPEQRTWTGWSFAGYWFSDLFTITGWQIASSTILSGLSTNDAIILAVVAGFCNSIPTALNGAIGAKYHIPFPVAVRSSFGYWFSYFAVLTRSILALFWFSLQGWGGSWAARSIIIAIWPSFAQIPNTMPESAGTTTQMMISYVVYNAIQFPLLLIPTHRLQWLFLLKAVLVTPMVMAMTIWTCLQAGGGSEIFQVKATVSGSERAWLWLMTMTSLTGGYSTIAVNVPDFSRFSKTTTAQWYQLPLIPLIKTFTSLFGIICTGASVHIYGEYVWNPLEIVNSWGTTPGGRAAGFFCALVWLIAQICNNISANCISFANDMTTLFPRYFNIRRSVVFAAIVGSWGMVPWKINNAATSLLKFMSAYAIIMGPFAGIMVCDYWIVRRGLLDVPGLYNPDGRYRYNKYGTNWRTLVVLLVILGPLIPGLANYLSPSSVSIDTGLERLYSINWLFGFFASMGGYYVLMTIFKPSDTMLRHGEVLNGDAVMSADIETPVSSEKFTHAGKENEQQFNKTRTSKDSATGK